MDFSLFKKIIDECKENNFEGTIAPFLNGEALLVPNILHYLKYIRKQIPNASISLYTNASKLSNEIGLKIIKENLLDILTISFDGGTKEAYESVRVGLSFEDVKKNVHTFINNRNILKKEKLKVIISMVVTKENIDTKKDLEKEFSDADEVGFHKFFNYAGQLSPTQNKQQNKLKNFLYKQNFCNRLRDCITILVNGDVALCCFDYEGKVIIGNVKNSTIKEVWNGERLERIREDLKHRNFDKLPLCSRCSFLDNNILERQLVKIEPKIKKNKRLYKFLKNIYVDRGIE
jgi:radical SAM protein with 4Fe4S-binding SPASM domain